MSYSWVPNNFTGTSEIVENEDKDNGDKGQPKEAIVIPPWQLPVRLSEFPKFSLCPTTVPTPPDWEARNISALAKYPDARTRFIRVSLNKASSEYTVLTNLIHSKSPMCPAQCPIIVEKIELVINMTLWRKFLVHHKQTMGIKSTSNLPTKYSDNICLLFHGTRALNIDSILLDGLDDRKARGGSYGTGIYFADDPYKSIGYDLSGKTLLLCAVFLGDCLQVNSHSGPDPTKSPSQMRYSGDGKFDSIVSSQYAHEFVAFTRFQCYPLYVITYRQGMITDTELPPDFPYSSTPFAESQSSHEVPFAWKIPSVNQEAIPPGPLSNPFGFFAQSQFGRGIPFASKKPSSNQVAIPPGTSQSSQGISSALKKPSSNQEALPPGPLTNPYPFFAQTIFKLMLSVNDSSTSTRAKKTITTTTEELMSQLRELGFENDSLNLDLLAKYKNELEFVVDELIQLREKEEAEKPAEVDICTECSGIEKIDFPNGTITTEPDEDEHGDWKTN